MSLHLQNVDMAKNLIKERIEQRLKLNERLLNAVNSKEEFEYLKGERDGLQNALFEFIQLKGGAE